MISRLPFVYALATCAAVYALCMIAFGWGQLVDTFRLADPTGLFGFFMHAANFVSNICVVVMAVLLVVSIEKRQLIPYKVCLLVFGIKLLEAISLSPCLMGWGDAFCGLWWVLLSQVTAPILIAITFVFLITSGKKVLVRTAFGLATVILTAGTLSFLLLTPKTHEACMDLDSITGRAACLEKFALRDSNVEICRKIEFRSTRFNCLYNVARDTETPALCEEITDPAEAEIASYETPSLQTKDLCYYLLGFKMRSQDMCQKVNDEEMRNTCIKGTGSATAKQ